MAERTGDDGIRSTVDTVNQAMETLNEEVSGILGEYNDLVVDLETLSASSQSIVQISAQAQESVGILSDAVSKFKVEKKAPNLRAAMPRRFGGTNHFTPSAISSTSCTSLTGINLIPCFTWSGISSRSRSLAFGIIIVLILFLFAATVFSLRPPIGRT